MNWRRPVVEALCAAGAVGALSLSGWAATGRGPHPHAHPFTLAPIMATTSTGHGRPPRPLRPMRVATAPSPR